MHVASRNDVQKLIIFNVTFPQEDAKRFLHVVFNSKFDLNQMKTGG